MARTIFRSLPPAFALGFTFACLYAAALGARGGTIPLLLTPCVFLAVVVAGVAGLTNRSSGGFMGFLAVVAIAVLVATPTPVELTLLAYARVGAAVYASLLAWMGVHDLAEEGEPTEAGDDEDPPPRHRGVL